MSEIDNWSIDIAMVLILVYCTVVN